MKITRNRLAPAVLIVLLTLWSVSHGRIYVTHFFVPQEPPKETGTFRKPDLVELIKLDRSIKLDIRYATSTTFSGGRSTKKLARFFNAPPPRLSCARTNLCESKATA